MTYILLMLSMCFNLALQPKPLKQPKILTEISSTDLMRVLQKGHFRIFGEEPSNKRLAMGWAQVALENGQGKKTYNYNFGNIGAIGKKTPYYLQSGHKFLSNNNFLSGAEIYWKTIKNMCPSSLKYFDVGDSNGAARQLARCGYYRADPDFYSSLMTNLFYTAQKELIKTQTILTSEAMEVILKARDKEILSLYKVFNLPIQ